MEAECVIICTPAIFCRSVFLCADKSAAAVTIQKITEERREEVKKKRRR